MEFKLNIGCPKAKKCYKKELKDDDCRVLIEKKIGDIIKGEAVGFKGYEFQITGGSDYCGFPMRKDVNGSQRKKILIASGVGIKKRKRKGIRLRKTVAGSVINENTVQINMKTVKYGPEPMEKPAETSETKEVEKKKEEEKK